MLIEKDIFISGLIISVGCASNIKGFISGMNDISFDPCQQYATWGLGLAFWCKCTKLSFTEWPFMYNPVDLYSYGTWEVVRYSNLVRVKTGVNSIEDSRTYRRLIRSQVRFLDPFYFCVAYSIDSFTKIFRYGKPKPFSVSKFRVSSGVMGNPYNYWMFLEIEFSYGWILVFDHLGREIGALYVRHLYDNFVRRYRDYHSDNNIEMGGFVIRAKRTSSYITVQLLCGEILESYIRVKVSALLALQPFQP